MRPAGAPPDTALEAVVFAAHAGDVTDVVVDGRPVVVDGDHVHVDVAEELGASITALMDR